MTQFSSDGKTAIERTIELDIQCKRTPPSELDSVYEIERCKEWIIDIGAKTVCLQFPDKLLADSFDVSLRLQKLLAHNQVFILGDTSYGSCCVDEVTAQHVSADAIIHFGHACLSLTDRIPVLHIFEKYPLDVERFVCEFTNNFQKDSNIILLYDVAYEHCISGIREKLCSDYRNLHIPLLTIRGNEETDTVICGRCFSVPRETVVKDYAVVFLGKNERTFQNIVLELSGAKVFIFDPYDNILMEHNVNNNKFLMKRMFLIEKVKDARILCILVGTLGVSKYLSAIDRIKNLAKERGKKCYIIVVGKPNVPKLANFPEIDVFVLLACPENSFIDERFFKPLVTAYDFELACNPNRPWSNIYLTNFQDFLCDVNDRHTSDVDLEYALSNVSLTGGHLQNMEKYNNEETVEGDLVSNTVSLKSNTALSLYGASGSHFLANRSWRGLEQDLGQTKVEHASKGRRGIPMCYENEPNSKLAD